MRANAMASGTMASATVSPLKRLVLISFTVYCIGIFVDYFRRCDSTLLSVNLRLDFDIYMDNIKSMKKNLKYGLIAFIVIYVALVFLNPVMCQKFFGEGSHICQLS